MIRLKKESNHLLVVFLSLTMSIFAQAQKPEGIKSFDAFFTRKPVSDTGLFIIHRDEEHWYFEIPDSLLQKDMLIVSRRIAMSSSEIDPMVAGDFAQPGLMVVWDKTPDGQSILLRKVTTRNLMRFSGKDTAFGKAVQLQTLDPVLLSFPIKARGNAKLSSIIDIKPLFVADIKELNPFAQNPLLKALGIAGKKYKFESDRSFFKTAQVFLKNVEVKSLLTYSEGDNIYSILLNRSMVLLPDQPMQPRFADDRVGYFVHNYTEYNESKPVQTRYLVHRWRLEPKAGQEDKLQKGMPVEPVKPITFYIDPATPQKWVKYIRQGIEDWLPAFEAAGFSNAIMAKNAPVNNPAFHPEDIRYSVIRYTASDIANAKGPSVIDPRSGEILESDIIIYHNILQLLRNWRFAQTAAVDPRLHTTGIPDEIIGEALRYVVAHEVGHALGLRHNMAASFAFPVDSLRSATFTQRYGTTPSIMDYARFNYVAQPGDKGVKLTPPLLGVYDTFAISWGYKRIPGAKRATEEIPVLNTWIEQHAGDPFYRFGEGDVNGTDPSCQRESLGNDVIKASEYGMRNIRYILAHLHEWLGKRGDKPDVLEDHLTAVLRQYERYIDHVSTNIAGVYQHYPVQGDPESRHTYVDKQEQQRSVAFVLRQYRELPRLLSKKTLRLSLNIVNKVNGIRRLVPVSSYIERFYTTSFQRDLLNNGKLAYLIDNKVANGDAAYSAEDLLNDIRKEVFKEPLRESSGFYEQLLQSVYVDRLINMTRFSKPAGNKQAIAAFHDREIHTGIPAPCFSPVDAQLPSQQVHGAFPAYGNDMVSGDDHLYFQYMDFRATDKQFKVESLILDELKTIKTILQHAVKHKDRDAGHYAFLLKRIEAVL